MKTAVLCPGSSVASAAEEVVVGDGGGSGLHRV